MARDVAGDIAGIVAGILAGILAEWAVGGNRMAMEQASVIAVFAVISFFSLVANGGKPDVAWGSVGRRRMGSLAVFAGNVAGILANRAAEFLPRFGLRGDIADFIAGLLPDLPESLPL